MDYATLRQNATNAGLFRRQYAYYALKTVVTILLLAASIFILALVKNPLVQVANTALLAVVFVQLGMLMHDAGHQQIFNSQRKNAVAGLLFGNATIGLSSVSWRYNHNKHHGAPNDEEEDPDVHVPFLAYSEKQALEKRGITRFITKHQALFWLPLMCIATLVVRTNHSVNVVRMLLRGWKTYAGLYYLLEVVLIVTSTVAYFALLFHFLGVVGGFGFFLLHYLLTGLYMGTVFATNHKGMPLTHKGQVLDFATRQIITTRNVKGSMLTDFWTGGLNYQIEHHLFPTMPRNNLSKARGLVKEFCKENNIEYYETGFFYSYKEILAHFHKVSAVLRVKKPLTVTG